MADPMLDRMLDHILGAGAVWLERELGGTPLATDFIANLREAPRSA
jgi:hypothetical protein